MKVDTARAAADLLAGLFAGAEIEKLAVVHLDADAHVLAVREHPGSLEDEIEIPIRAIISDALELGSVALILAHNHPSGDPQPSWDDVEATRELASTAARLGIRLHDHLIFADAEPCSLRGLGLL